MSIINSICPQSHFENPLVIDMKLTETLTPCMFHVAKNATFPTFSGTPSFSRGSPCVITLAQSRKMSYIC